MRDLKIRATYIGIAKAAFACTYEVIRSRGQLTRNHASRQRFAMLSPVSAHKSRLFAMTILHLLIFRSQTEAWVSDRVHLVDLARK